MSGGSASAGWSLPAVGWVSLFVGTGLAIHSTFWHNNYGEPSSRDCVNASPEAARWIFRWSNPVVPYEPGDKVLKLAKKLAGQCDRSTPTDHKDQ